VSIILAIDQGTTSTRALLFQPDGTMVAVCQQELSQIFPQPGWVEHDPDRIWDATTAVVSGVLAQAGMAAAQIATLGITNQRETTILWDRRNGQVLHNAIVWQDRRTDALCRRLVHEGKEAGISARTGLLLDPYFSATKLVWLLDNLPGARRLADQGHLAFGTIDSFLLWRLTGGVHATDETNAARTLLYDIHRHEWSADLLALFDIPPSLLPEVRDSAGLFGHTKADLFGHAIPITGIAGDQQAAAFGQACFAPGHVKATFGTGCFVLQNTGQRVISSANRLLSTPAYRLNGATDYALEGSVFVAGAAIQWLRDGLKLIESAGQTDMLARTAPSDHGVYLVPAFAGLGAPWWDAQARGALLGLSRDTGIATIVRAALEAVCYQTRDLLDAMARDTGQQPIAVKVDGGMAANDWAMQFLADIIGLPVDRPRQTESTALGAALLAGLGAGILANTDQIDQFRQPDRLFIPSMPQQERDRLHDGWQHAVRRVLSRP